VTVFTDIFMTSQFCPTDKRFRPRERAPSPGIENPVESYDSEAHFAPNACGNRASIIETQAKVTIRGWMRPTSDTARESVPMHRPPLLRRRDVAELSSSSAGCGPREKQPLLQAETAVHDATQRSYAHNVRAFRKQKNTSLGMTGLSRRAEPRRGPPGRIRCRESTASNLALAARDRVGHIEPSWRCGRVAEGGGLLNRYRVVKPYRGFESLRLRQYSSANIPMNWISKGFRLRPDGCARADP
jgi:hypothetical protein